MFESMSLRIREIAEGDGDLTQANLTLVTKEWTVKTSQSIWQFLLEQLRKIIITYTPNQTH